MCKCEFRVAVLLEVDPISASSWRRTRILTAPGGEPDLRLLQKGSKVGLPPGRVRAGLPPGRVRAGLPPGRVRAGLPSGRAKTGLPAGRVRAGLPSGRAKTGLERPELESPVLEREFLECKAKARASNYQTSKVISVCRSVRSVRFRRNPCY